MPFGDVLHSIRGLTAEDDGARKEKREEAKNLDRNFRAIWICKSLEAGSGPKTGILDRESVS